jgi:LacI family transcriptional regulator
MAVTMKDIARDLGVSVVTVSKALRNHTDISEKMRQRVLKRVRELNYYPNLAARALVTGKTYALGLVVPDLVHPFFAEVAQGLSSVLRHKNYSLLIASSEEDPRLERQEIERLLSRGVDALIIASTQSTVENFRRIEENNTPYILVDRRFMELPANFVGVDDVVAGPLPPNISSRWVAGESPISGVRQPAPRWGAWKGTTRRCQRTILDRSAATSCQGGQVMLRLTALTRSR